MARILISPGKYVQGKGELGNLNSHIEGLGCKKALVLATDSGYKRVKDVVENGIKNSDVDIVVEYFNRECTTAEINRLKDLAVKNNCDIIVGIGGGKIADTAKAAAYYAKVPVIVVPTTASTDAPCSALSVIYTEQGVVERYLFLPSNPNVVIMDTDVIVNSPVKLTVAGMGDALATYFEARACVASSSLNCPGGLATSAAMSMSELCFKTLMNEGVKAKIALEAKSCTQAVENIIEANTLMSGLGFESAGLAAAHAIHNGMTALDETHEFLHGEKVAFGTLVQLVLENAPLEEMEMVIAFCIEVGLPVTLGQLGVKDVNREVAMKVADLACAEGETIYNMPMPITVEKVADAILAADNMGKFYLG